jgi:hypothetical protein
MFAASQIAIFFNDIRIRGSISATSVREFASEL